MDGSKDKALDLLASVVASIFSAYRGCLDQLRIHHASTWLRIPSQADSQPFAHGPVDPLPSTVDAPGSEVVVNGWPSLGKSWGSRRHWQPLYLGKDVEDGALTKTVGPRW